MGIHIHVGGCAVVGSQWWNLMFTSMFLKRPVSLHNLTELFPSGNIIIFFSKIYDILEGHCSFKLDSYCGHV